MDTGVGCGDTAETLAKDLYDFAKSSRGFAGGRVIKQQEDSSELLNMLFDNFTDETSTVKFTEIDIFVPTLSGDDASECSKATGVLNHRYYNKMPENIKNRILFIPTIATQSDTGEQLTEEDQDKAYKHAIYSLEIPETADNPVTVTVTNLFNNSLLPTPYEDTSTVPDFLRSCDDGNFDTTNISTQKVIIPDPNEQYFIIALNRFRNDRANVTKIVKPIDINNAEITLGTSRFTIKGCICHHGDGPNSGHYTYVEFENGIPKMVYDDTHICPYSIYVTSFKRTVDVTGYVLLFERKPKS
jgi:hypothetical protein